MSVHTWLDLGWLLLRDAWWSAIAALGFAVLFSVPPRLLWGCMLGGAVGHVVRTLCMQVGLSIEVGTLLGAMAIGLLGEWLARRTRAPVQVFTVSAAIPMVPGAFAFGTMLNLIDFSNTADASTGQMLLWQAAYNAVKTALVLAAIAFGMTWPALVLRRRRPVV
nr:threonine/serine exporter family protein [Ardenticatena sp.]